MEDKEVNNRNKLGKMQFILSYAFLLPIMGYLSAIGFNYIFKLSIPNFYIIDVFSGSFILIYFTTLFFVGLIIAIFIEKKR